MEQNYKILLPKIKKMEFKCKIMLDPADFRRGLPKNKLPQLNEKGLILSLESGKTGVAKMTGDGSLKLNIVYTAQVFAVVHRYIEVKVIDDYKDAWIGMFLGVTVKGSGGQGQIRGCRVLRVEGSCLIVEAISQAGNQLWQKLYKKVERILEENN